MNLENPIMNRNVSLALTLIREAKLPAVRQLADEMPDVSHEEAWGDPLGVALVRLDKEDQDANVMAFEWIAQHPDLKILDTVESADATSEVLAVQLIDARAANARRNASELRTKIAKRRLDARNDMDTRMPAAINVDFHLGKVVQWEAELECWERIADKPREFRDVFSFAVVDLINGLGHSANALEDALRQRKLEGLRTFVRRARVFMDDQDAVDALLSF